MQSKDIWIKSECMEEMQVFLFFKRMQADLVDVRYLLLNLVVFLKVRCEFKLVHVSNSLCELLW